MANHPHLPAAVRDRVDQVVEASVAAGKVPGAVAGIACGDDVHVSIAGCRALDGSAMTRDTLFRITSMTKPQTAALVLTFVDGGELALDDPVERFLPELADRRVLRQPDGPLEDTVPVDHPFTVRELLTFTWGFGMQGAMFMAPEPWPIVQATVDRRMATFGPPEPATTVDPDAWLAALAELPLLAQPGERWLYQSAAQVLGLLAARVAGTSFDRALRDRLHAPLGMDDTRFWTDDTARLATAYLETDAGNSVSDAPDGQWSRPPAFPDGGAGLLSTVDDCLAFGRALAAGGGGVLEPETVRQMTSGQLTDEQRQYWPGFSFLGDRSWGLGMSVRPDGCYGWDGGFGSTWVNDPSTGLSIVVLTQQSSMVTGMTPVCEEVVQAARAAVA